MSMRFGGWGDVYEIWSVAGFCFQGKDVSAGCMWCVIRLTFANEYWCMYAEKSVCVCNITTVCNLSFECSYDLMSISSPRVQRASAGETV